MHNLYYYFLVISILLQIFFKSVVAIKIDTTMQLINEQLISSCITEQSKLETENGLELSRLELDCELVKALVNNNIRANLSNMDSDIKYYFYDFTTKKSCSVGNNYCNSVQIKIDISYKGKTYERILRYEPIQA